MLKCFSKCNALYKCDTSREMKMYQFILSSPALQGTASPPAPPLPLLAAESFFKQILHITQYTQQIKAKPVWVKWRRGGGGLCSASFQSPTSSNHSSRGLWDTWAVPQGSLEKDSWKYPALRRDRTLMSALCFPRKGRDSTEKGLAYGITWVKWLNMSTSSN